MITNIQEKRQLSYKNFQKIEVILLFNTFYQAFVTLILKSNENITSKNQYLLILIILINTNALIIDNAEVHRKDNPLIEE